MKIISASGLRLRRLLGRWSAAAATCLAAWSVLGLCPAPVEARVARIVIDKKESLAYEGKSFGAAGPYERITGRAFGELDPRDARNAVITDLDLAPRNDRGRRAWIGHVLLFPDLQFSLWPFKSSLNLQYQVAANDMGNYRYSLAVGFDPGRCRSLPAHDLEGRGEPRLLPFSIGEFHRPLAPQYHAAFRLIEAIGIQITWIIGNDLSSLGFHGSRLAILHGVGQCVLRRPQFRNQSAAGSPHVQ